MGKIINDTWKNGNTESKREIREERERHKTGKGKENPNFYKGSTKS